MQPLTTKWNGASGFCILQDGATMSLLLQSRRGRPAKHDKRNEQILQMHEEGKSFKEISRVMGLSPDACRKAADSARAKEAKKLAENLSGSTRGVPLGPFTFNTFWELRKQSP